jgi:CRP-like cAMP-binding protein
MSSDDAGKRLSRELVFSAIAPTLALEQWELERMTSILEEHSVASGDYLFERGRPVEYLYFMRNGSVEVTGGEGPPWRFEGSWMFGLLDYFLGVPHIRSARTIVDQNLLRSRTSDWLELLEDSFDLAQHTITVQARDLAKRDLGSSAAQRAGARPPAAAGATSESASLAERVATLRTMRPLRDAGVQSLVDLASFASERSLPAGASACEDASENLYFVVTGQVETGQAPLGSRGAWGPGSLVGGLSALADSDLGIGRTLEPTRLLSVARQAWREVTRNHFQCIRSVLIYMAVERERILEWHSSRAKPLVFQQSGYGLLD